MDFLLSFECILEILTYTSTLGFTKSNSIFVLHFGVLGLEFNFFFKNPCLKIKPEYVNSIQITALEDASIQNHFVTT